MKKHSIKYFDDDGKEIDPDIISKPDLCVTCKKDEIQGEEEILCNLTRTDQQGQTDFKCDAYEPKGYKK